MTGAVTSATRRHWRRCRDHRGVVLAGLGIVVAPTAESATPHDGQTLRRHPFRALQFALTPRALQAAADATATPTPRVIVIQPTSTPGSPPTATSPPSRAALPTATAPVITIETPAPQASTPTPTATPSPTAPPTPTATAHGHTDRDAVANGAAEPDAAVAPTLAPGSDVRLEFTAEDWLGGYFRGDSQAYGRPWVAVYGALSEYPRATLAFTLDATPGRAATISITGLDDEWADAESGRPGGQRRSRLLRAKPVPELGRSRKRRECRLDDGALHDPQRRAARGTERDRLCQPQPGRQLQCAALCPAGGRRPGDHQADCRRGAAPTPTRSRSCRPSRRGAFTAEDWVGAFYRGDEQFYGRPWSAIYGAASEYPQATIRFRLDARAKRSGDADG